MLWNRLLPLVVLVDANSLGSARPKATGVPSTAPLAPTLTPHPRSVRPEIREGRTWTLDNYSTCMWSANPMEASLQHKPGLLRDATWTLPFWDLCQNNPDRVNWTVTNEDDRPFPCDYNAEASNCPLFFSLPVRSNISESPAASACSGMLNPAPIWRFGIFACDALIKMVIIEVPGPATTG